MVQIPAVQIVALEKTVAVQNEEGNVVFLQVVLLLGHCQRDFLGNSTMLFLLGFQRSILHNNCTFCILKFLEHLNSLYFSPPCAHIWKADLYITTSLATM